MAKTVWAILLLWVLYIPLAWAPPKACSPAPCIALTLVSSAQLGTYFGGNSNRRFILNANGTISGPDAADYVTGAAEAQITVGDSGFPASINIFANNITTTGGLAVNEALCVYNNGPQTRCDGAGYSVTSQEEVTLQVGLDFTTTTTHNSTSNASISFDVNVIYN